jgi:trigger factor
VPAALVERDYKENIESTTLERLIPDVCDEAIKSESLDVISAPKVQNLALDDPEVVRFDLELEVRPELQLASLEGLRGTRWTFEITDEHVGRALDDLREQHAQYAVVERPAADGDIVQFNYVPLDEHGHERAEQRVENYAFQIGAGNVVGEFETALRGKSAGDTVTAQVSYPADHAEPELAGKTVGFLLTLVAVKEKRLPAADDDLGRDLGLENLEALRTQVRADLQRRVHEDSDRDLRESLVNALLQANSFEPPASMVQQYVDSVSEDWEKSRQRAGATTDDAQRQEFARAARNAGERVVKRALVLETVAREHGLQVSEEDVDKWIEEKVLAGGSGATELRAFFAEARRRRRLRGELTDDKVFDFLTSKAEIAEVSRTSADSPAAT